MVTPLEVRVDLPPELVDAVLNDIHGPVADILKRIAEDMERIASRKVHVRIGNVWSEETTNARPPGFTKASIKSVYGHSRRTGKLFGGVNAAYDPTIFLEHKAQQMHKSYPFLTTALWTVSLP